MMYRKSPHIYRPNTNFSISVLSLSRVHNVIEEIILVIKCLIIYGGQNTTPLKKSEVLYIVVAV